VIQISLLCILIHSGNRKRMWNGLATFCHLNIVLKNTILILSCKLSNFLIELHIWKFILKGQVWWLQDCSPNYSGSWERKLTWAREFKINLGKTARPYLEDKTKGKSKIIYLKSYEQSWGCGSVVEYVPSIRGPGFKTQNWKKIKS
jgi:hypothetical protein